MSNNSKCLQSGTSPADLRRRRGVACNRVRAKRARATTSSIDTAPQQGNKNLNGTRCSHNWDARSVSQSQILVPHLPRCDGAFDWGLHELRRGDAGDGLEVTAKARFVVTCELCVGRNALCSSQCGPHDCWRSESGYICEYMQLCGTATIQMFSLLTIFCRLSTSLVPHAEMPLASRCFVEFKGMHAMHTFESSTRG